MNKKAYYRETMAIRDYFESDEFRYVFKVVENVYSVNQAIQNLDYSVFNPSTSVADQRVASTRNKINAFIQESIRLDKVKTKVRQFNRYCMRMEDQLKSFLESEAKSCVLGEQFNAFFEIFDDFLDSYDHYRSSFTHSHYYELSFKARDLTVAFEHLSLAIDIVLESYEHTGDTENSCSLELYLSNVSTLTSFGAKLQSLDELYLELCRLFNVPTSDAPITIEHIENGSLLARISGSPLIVGVLTTILNSSAAYYIANYPQKNEIVELKERVETLDSMFELSEKLKAAGFETEEMQQDINSSLKKITKSTDKLFGDQPDIEINDSTFNLDADNSQKLLEEVKRLELQEFNQQA